MEPRALAGNPAHYKPVTHIMHFEHINVLHLKLSDRSLNQQDSQIGWRGDGIHWKKILNCPSLVNVSKFHFSTQQMLKNHSIGGPQFELSLHHPRPQNITSSAPRDTKFKQIPENTFKSNWMYFSHRTNPAQSTHQLINASGELQSTWKNWETRQNTWRHVVNFIWWQLYPRKNPK